MAHSPQPAGTAHTVPVRWTGDVVEAAGLARKMAVTMGFPAEHCAELHIVVSELATNLIRHASHGTITLSPLQEEERIGIQIESEDEGPGIADVEMAMTDGYSTADGLGIGLGTINRLMDDLEVSSGPLAGVRIVCRRWLRPAPQALAHPDI